MTSYSQFAVRGLWIVLCACSPLICRADFIAIPMPGAPYPGGGTYLTETTNLPITLAEFGTATSLSDGDLTVTFSTPLQALVVPDSWGSWAAPPETESDSPTVLWTQGAATLRLTFDQPLDAFGFELQPNELATFQITADYQFLGSSVGTVIRDVNGDGGARLFAAVSTPPDAPFTEVLISTGGADFAIAQIRYHIVPEPSTGLLAAILASLVAAKGFHSHKRRKVC